MQEYKVELKQTVERPRIRISRKFIRMLMADRSISVNGDSNLFYYTALCSYAAFGASDTLIGDVKHTVQTGEWICRIDQMASWFRTATLWRVLSILDKLRQMRLISYTRLGSERQFINFKITDWTIMNNIYEVDNPNPKRVFSRAKAFTLVNNYNREANHSTPENDSYDFFCRSSFLCNFE
jgi:hypothetical protein